MRQEGVETTTDDRSEIIPPLVERSTRIQLREAGTVSADTSTLTWDPH